eukprot:TRINITY_DN6499_c0_g1_i1.p1 TRINITY_DN6499_c0_g1~~TRINITY_DN6499_c0_g1_i1.p1  ORF type:complete len:269 (-),score=18.01 TRINITY_DN6499_c0_g1_i1:105-911(-)
MLHLSRILLSKRSFSKRNASHSTASIVIIGDEILNGSTLESNSHYLAKSLFQSGIELQRIEVVPDKTKDIVDSLRRSSDLSSYVFTSGGIGPTHDDITYEAIANGFTDGKMEFHEPTLSKLAINYKERTGSSELNDARKRMAYFPSPCKVHYPANSLWVPMVQVKNIFILPGVPRLFQTMIDGGFEKGIWGQSDNLFREFVYTNMFEGDLADALTSVQKEYPNLKLGSYPGTDTPYKVKISITGDCEVTVKLVTSILKTKLQGFDINK